MKKLHIFIISILLFISCTKQEDFYLNPTNGKTTVVFNPKVHYSTLTDQDGNIYKTVKIVNQTWMAENLRTTSYNDGTEIPNLTNIEDWWFVKKIRFGAYCNYNNTDNLDTIATYGRLYNWYAIDEDKLCPQGWHVPSSNEFEILINNIGGSDSAAIELKESGNSHWITIQNIYNTATNKTGFTSIPSGSRSIYFHGISAQSNYWTITTGGSCGPIFYAISHWFTDIYSSSTDKRTGLSVRCIKDY